MNPDDVVPPSRRLKILLDLIVTDGSNASYLTRPSWVGGIVFVALAAIYAIAIAARKP